MISLYLNSLYNLMVYNNPLRMMLLSYHRTWKAMWNIQRNMGRAKKRLVLMNQRLQAVEAYIEFGTHATTHRFDRNR